MTIIADDHFAFCPALCYNGSQYGMAVERGEEMEQKLRRDRNIGGNLRRLREAHRLSQEKLCAELQRRGCDIGRTTYAKYEAGQLNIRASVLIELRRLYGCSYDEFFWGLDGG